MRRAVTLTELLIVSVVLLILYAVGVVIFTGSRGIRETVRANTCRDQLRGIHQGLVLFAQNNNEAFPLPSALDRADRTVQLAPGEHATTKDTTANIFSLLITQTFFGPELCVCPAERNPKIRMDAAFFQPAVPEDALWNTSFSADFTSDAGGSFSYAHTRPAGPRLTRWANTFRPSEAVLADRGPLISDSAKQTSPTVAPDYSKDSISLRLHGLRRRWAGNIAFADGHVAFAENLWGQPRPDDQPITYTDAAGAPWLDLLHFDEPDDPARLNNFLGLFTTAGPSPVDFHAIWD